MAVEQGIIKGLEASQMERSDDVLDAAEKSEGVRGAVEGGVDTVIKEQKNIFDCFHCWK